MGTDSSSAARSCEASFLGNNVAGISPGCHSLKPHSGERFSPSRAMWLAGFLSLLLGTIVICKVALVIIFYSSRNVQIGAGDENVLDENDSMSPEPWFFEEEEDVEDYGEDYDQFIQYRNQEDHLLDGCATSALKEM